MPARGSRQVTLPLTINFAQAAEAALALGRGSATFAVSGELRSGPASVPFSLSQAVTFQR